MCPHDPIRRTDGIPLPSIVLEAPDAVPQRLRQGLRRGREAGTEVLFLSARSPRSGRSARPTADLRPVHPTTADRVLGHYRTYGAAVLADGRADNGADQLDADFLGHLGHVGRATPTDYGWRRPTGTRGPRVEAAGRRTGVRVAVTTRRRALARIGPCEARQLNRSARPMGQILSPGRDALP
jgi:hypothetical protein